VLLSGYANITQGNATKHIAVTVLRDEVRKPRCNYSWFAPTIFAFSPQLNYLVVFKMISV